MGGRRNRQCLVTNLLHSLSIVHCVDASARASGSGIGGTHGGISNGVDRMGRTGGDLSGIWVLTNSVAVILSGIRVP